MIEIWRAHPQLTDYEISDCGRVRRATGGRGATAGRTLKPMLHHSGYLHVRLKRRYRFVHVLVLEAFVSAASEGQECRHLNGSRADNALTNLEWGAPAQNYADSVRHGTAPIGARNGRTHLDDEGIAAIRARYAAGGISQRALAVQCRLPAGTIFSILQRRSWKHVT